MKVFVKIKKRPTVPVAEREYPRLIKFLGHLCVHSRYESEGGRGINTLIALRHPTNVWTNMPDDVVLAGEDIPAGSEVTLIQQ